MKRLPLLVLMAGGLAVAAFGQEPAPRPGEAQAEHAKTGEDEGNLEIWKWANFAILAGVLGWMIAKNAPAFFASRTEQIQRGIAEAAKIRKDAEARAADMEKRMASLQKEIELLQLTSTSEMEKEADRIRIASGQQMRRIQAHGEQEIAAMAKRAENELRAEAAQLAIDLAEQRIRSRMSGDTQNQLIQRFIGELNREAPRNEVR